MNDKATGKLSRLSAAIWASPTLPLSGLSVPVIVFLPPYYATEMGLGLQATGLIFMLARIFDIIIDPLVGTASDRTRLAFGRRKSWMLGGMPLVLVGAWFLYFPSAPSSIFYLTLSLFVIYVGWTMISIPHIAWGSELTRDYHERSGIQAWFRFGDIAGMLLVLVLPAIVEATRPANVDTARVHAMGGYLLVLLPITVLAALRFVPDVSRRTGEQDVSLLRALRAAFRHAPARTLLIIEFLTGITTGVTSSLVLFILADAYQLGEQSSLVLLIYFLFGLIMTPVTVPIVKRFSKHRALAVSVLLPAATVFLFFAVVPGSLLSAAAVFCVQAITSGCAYFLTRSLMGDVADDASVRTGRDCTGLYFSLVVTIAKLGPALAIGITYTVLSWIGYTPKSANSPESISAMLWLFVLLSSGIGLFQAAMIWRFPIGQADQVRNRAILDERHELARNRV